MPSDTKPLPDNPLSLDMPDNQGPEPAPRALTPEEKREVMSRPVGKFQPTTEPAPQSLTLAVLKTMPLFTALLGSVDGGANAVEAYASTTHALTVKMASASKGLHLAGLVLDAANFVLVPMTALVAWFVNEKPPFTVSNGAKWVYSAAVLGLGLTAFFVPPVAPFLIGGALLLAFGSSVATFAKLIKDRAMHKSEIKRLKSEIEAAQLELDNIQKISKNVKSDENIDALYEKFEEKKQKIQELINEKHDHDTRLELKDGVKMMDKGVGVALAALVVLGAGLTIAFPPLGLTIMAATAAVGALYIVGRVAVPLFKKLGEALGLLDKKEEVLAEEVQDIDLKKEADLEQEAALKHGVDLGHVADQELVDRDIQSEPAPVAVIKSAPLPEPEMQAPARDPHHFSSDVIMSQGMSVDPAHALENIAGLNVVTDRYQKKLEAAIQQDNPQALLEIVNEMSEKMFIYQTQPDVARELLSEVPGWSDKAAPMLARALNDLPADDPQKQAFHNAVSLKGVLDVKESRDGYKAASSGAADSLSEDEPKQVVH